MSANKSGEKTGGGGEGPSKMNRGEKKTNERLNGTKARVRLKCLESKR